MGHKLAKSPSARLIRGGIHFSDDIVFLWLLLFFLLVLLPVAAVSARSRTMWERLSHNRLSRVPIALLTWEVLTCACNK